MTSIFDRYQNYSGDLNLEYGGAFFNLEDWDYGYVEALRITDLDSAAGATGMVMVESISINVDFFVTPQLEFDGSNVDRFVAHFYDSRKAKDRESVSECCDLDRMLEGVTEERHKRILIAESCMNYGFCDVDYGGFILQTDPDEALRSSGYNDWTADERLPEDVDLLDYLEANGHLSNFE